MKSVNGFDGITYGGMGGWMEQHMGEMNGWMDGTTWIKYIVTWLKIDEWMDGWMNGRNNIWMKSMDG